MKRIWIFFLLFFILIQAGFAIDATNIIAYPVPFNPVNGSVKYLTINDLQGTSLDANSIKIEIFDINGSSLFSKSYTSFPVIWNGRKSDGDYVKPGTYIIKVQAEDTTGYAFAVKKIQIVVIY